LPSSVSPDYDQRKVIVYHDVAEFGDYDDNGGHGTHTSGSIAGDNHATIGGYDTNDGMAYNAKLVFQDIGQDNSPYVYPPADLNDLFQQAYDDGARIHSNSWGSSVNGAYTTYSKQCDEFIWNYKDFLILFSNGNSGPGSNTVGSPASAKNVVSVGATENGALAENMAYFSSHGPTDDGRMKPSVCAPGVSIWSADSDGNINSHNCGVVPISGTSMSCPTTAGAAALIRQYFVDGYCPTGSATAGDSITPSAALIKAMLINSGEEMTGSYTGGPIPSDGQGWGRILLDNALYFDGEARGLEIYDSDSVDTGESKTYNIAIDNQSEPLEITLVWTDYPSTPAAAINLVNDLNLVVTGPDGTHITPDNRNVVESVYMKTPSAGTYTITVTGYNVPEGPQPFALVITGGLGIGSKGAVYMDRDTYNCTGIVNATVKDADLNADNTTIEMAYVSIISFPTEATPENMTLTETGVDTATFTGSIRLTTSPPVPDGNLSIAHRDLMIVFYEDADDGTGNIATMHDTAAVDCLVPIITIAAPQNNTAYSSNSVDLDYSVNERTEWGGYSLDGLPIVIISGNTTLTNLTDGWHNVTVFAGDVAGNIGASDLVWFNITTPDIWVHPESFEIILPQGNITNETLTIGNNGTGVLEFEITDQLVSKAMAFKLADQIKSKIEVANSSNVAVEVVKVIPHSYSPNGEPAKVALFKNYDPWGYTAIEDILVAHSIPYDVYTSSSMGNIDLSQYDKVITASVQGNTFWNVLTSNKQWFEDYVSNGGVLELHACHQGGLAGLSLPGGFVVDFEFIQYVSIVDPDADVVNIPNIITDNDLDNWDYSAHGRFITIPVDSDVILNDTNDGMPEFVEHRLGSGSIITTVQTVEWRAVQGYPDFLENMLFDMGDTGCDWLTEYPQNDTIAPSNQTNITVTINATDLGIGKYNATIVINSNDPDESKVEVPVRLIVTQLYPPDIWVEPEAFDVMAFRSEVKYENLTIGNNGTGDLLFNATDTVTGLFLVDDMESGVGVWTHGGSYDEWELGTPMYGPPGAHSGSNCWGTDLDSTYSNNCDQWLMSSAIDLSSARNVNLSFYIWYGTESCCDPGYVEISRDNGITWTILKTYRGEGADWSHENFDISGYTGNSSVRIRFRLTSDGSVTCAGLYIDDVVVSEEGATNWLSVTPASDIIPPKNQTNLTIEINATSLDAGAYNATIIITHNDVLHDMVNLPVNLIVFSAPHDIAVTNITAPESAEINSTMVIDSTINNFGSNDEPDLTIDFMVDGVINQSKIISLANSSSTDVSFAWTAPGTPGVYNLTIYAEPVPGENITWDNQLSTNISVITIPDIWVYPEWFGLTLEKGEVTNRTLMIGNNGTGILNASISASLPTDVDLDNEQEIIVRGYSGSYTYIVNNSNLDTFNGWEWRSPYTDSYKGFAIADVNGDGTPDVLGGGYNYLRVYDIKNNSVLYSDLYTGCSYGGTAAGDIDNDGSVEMLVSDYDGYIYVYDGKTGLPDAQGHITDPTAYYGTGLGIGDIDNDGVAEVIRADRYGLDIFNGETRVLEREISISSLYNYPDLVFGDANGNGIADIYVGGEYGYVYAYEWNGFTATQLWRSLDLGSYTRPCGFVDADNDGDFEVFIGNSSGHITALNALTGGVEGSVFTGYPIHASCTVGDIDDDGVLEIATGNGDGYIRTYTYSNGRFTLEKKSVTYYGSDLGRHTDSMIISGAKDPRVFKEISSIQFNEIEVSVPPDSSHNVTISFDATDLNKGTYNATIDINSNDPDENMVNIPVNIMVVTPPHIISFSPIDPTPTQYVGTTNTFSVITDQVMTSNDWYIIPGIATLGNGTSSLTLTWAHPGDYNITYIGTNENGSVNTTWVVTVSEPGVPIITDWYNNKTEDNSTSVTINESELVYFSATAKQPVDAWNWCKDGVDQGLNYDNLTTSWGVNGTYIIVVNASNACGTSNTVVWNVTVKDVSDIEVDKTVWNPASRTWEKSIEANVSEILRFRCSIHNDGNCSLTNVTAADNLPESLEYAYNATHPENWISADNRTIAWLFGPIAPCENVTIEFDVHVVGSGTGTNMYNATAWCGGTGTWVYDENSVIINSSQLLPTPFLIHGWVYVDGDPVNNPDVNITNLNTSEAFVVETNESSNYYRVLTDSEDVNTDNVLHFYASDDGNVTEFDHVITQEEMNSGGFEQNITISSPSGKPDLVVAKEWVCDNYTICYNVTNIGDGIAQAGHNTTLYVDGEEVAYNIVPVVLAPDDGYTGCFDYIWIYTPPSDSITVCADFNNTIEESNETNNCLTGVWKCGDVDENGIVNIMDVRLLMNNVSCSGYPVDPWTGDVTGNGVIDSDDVQLLVAHVFNPAGHQLNCSTPVCS
jgi:uncharacterized repeat protein (TIGR01451 family)